MSKKYILVVKEEHYGVTYFPKPIDRTQLTSMSNFKYNKVDNCIDSKQSLLTQEEINELPYGFVKMFNIVEVEDTTYYWRKKQEYLCSFENIRFQYINEYNHGKLRLSSHVDECIIGGHNTKFTEQEAKELLGDDFEMFERVDIK